MTTPDGNYADEFDFHEEPVFGGTAWTVRHRDCGEQVVFRGTYAEAEEAARYGHDECPMYADRRA